MSEQGVPADEVTAKDFIMVRAKLVQRLGGANEALVWSRIEYRASSAKHAHETPDGQLWWAAARAVIAEETGLSVDQVKLALKHLIDDGYLLSAQHHGSDRTMSYSPVIAHVADLPDGVIPSGEDARSIGQGSPMQGVDLPDAPSTETSKTGEISVAVSPSEQRILVGFEAAWKSWPAARRGASKKALSSWRTAVKVVGLRRLEDLVGRVRAFGEVYATWPASEQRFVPMLTTWLNQGRWTTPLPEQRGPVKATTVDSARAAAEILAARERGGQRAIAS